MSTLYKISDSNPIVICGDLNARVGNKVEKLEITQKRTSIDKVTNNHGKNLMTFLEDSDNCILNGRITPEQDNFTCTRLGKSVVDYIITPVEILNAVKEMKVELITDLIEKHEIPITVTSTKIPDHSYLSCNIEISIYNRKDQVEEKGNSLTEINWLTKTLQKFKTKIIPNELYTDEDLQEAILKTANADNHDINEIYPNLINGIRSAMEKHLKPAKYNNSEQRIKRKQPFWNEDLATAYKETRKAEKDYLKKKPSPEIKVTREKREFYHMKRREFDKNFRTAERRYHAERRNRINQLNTTEPKEFWTEINKLGKPKVNKNDFRTKREDGSLENNGNRVLSKWANEFKNLYNTQGSLDFNENHLKQISKAQEEAENLPNIIINNNNRDGMAFVGAARNNGNIIDANHLNVKITMGEVIQAVNATKNGKAPGIDSIPNEIYKNNITHSALLTIFNKCLETGKTPEEWANSIIIPIHKQGKDKSEPLSYRGISLMATSAKIFTSILNNRIKQYLETNNLLCEEQNGFRKGRSCQDHIFVLNSILRNRIIKKQATFACFIDMAKAFDSVNHVLLWDALTKAGLKGKILETIKHMYSNIKASVNLDGHLTEWFKILGGVRQGDNLAPTLFAIFLNSLADKVKELKNGINVGESNIPILLYADDIVVMSESEEGLQLQLNTILEWTRDNRMMMNMDKTKIIHFRNNRKQQTKTNFTIGQETLEKCSSYKYLGLEINEHLKAESQIEALTKSASKALGNLVSKYRNAKGLRFETYTKLYNSTIVPIYHYGAEVWGYKEQHRINKIHERAMRMYLGVTNKTPLPSLYCETGWSKTITMRKIQMINFWLKIYNMNENRLTKKVFVEDYKLALLGSNNWNSDVKNILEEIEETDLFYGIGVEQKKKRRLNITKKLEIKEEKDIMENIKTLPKLRTYKNIKLDNSTEHYVKYVMNRKKRSLIAQLRIGILPINIETGRHRNEEVKDRTCPNCTESVENEHHFLLECKLYENIRTELFTLFEERNGFQCQNLPTDEKYFLLLNINNIIYHTGNFIEKAMEIRDNYIRNKNKV